MRYLDEKFTHFSQCTVLSPSSILQKEKKIANQNASFPSHFDDYTYVIPHKKMSTLLNIRKSINKYTEI